MNIIACVFNDIRGKPTSSGGPYVIQHEFRRADKGNDMLYDLSDLRRNNVRWKIMYKFMQ